MPKRSSYPAVAVAVVAVLLLAPVAGEAQEVRRSKITGESKSGDAEKRKPPKAAKASTPKRKRSFKSAPNEDVDTSRPAPTTLENALSVETNIPDELPAARSGPTRPSTD